MGGGGGGGGGGGISMHEFECVVWAKHYFQNLYCHCDSGPNAHIRQTVWRSYGDHAVIMLSPQLCIEIVQKSHGALVVSHGALAASVWRPCRDCTVAV